MKAASLKEVEKYASQLRASLNKLCKKLGAIQIGSKKQFPSGWGKAAKGRTVWRIVEEAISQNLTAKRKALGFGEVRPSDKEASIFDVVVNFTGDSRNLYLNFKAAVAGKETEKGDISKAEKLEVFFVEGAKRQLFIATFGIAFHEDMTIAIKHCLVTPIAWLPDIYVNPSNNGNLQCSQPKNLNAATKRTNAKFLTTLKSAMRTAARKRKLQQEVHIQHR
jgi:hypothetical protein